MRHQLPAPKLEGDTRSSARAGVHRSHEQKGAAVPHVRAATKPALQLVTQWSARTVRAAVHRLLELPVRYSEDSPARNEDTRDAGSDQLGRLLESMHQLSLSNGTHPSAQIEDLTASEHVGVERHPTTDDDARSVAERQSLPGRHPQRLIPRRHLRAFHQHAMWTVQLCRGRCLLDT